MTPYMLIDSDGRRIYDAWRNLRKPILSASEAAGFEAQCRASKALCFYGEDGILVVTLRIQEGDRELFILMGVAARPGAVERLEPAVLQLARDLGARTIAFEARRKGWARRLDASWQQRGTEFVRYV
jgi:hypothetical protein